MISPTSHDGLKRRGLLAVLVGLVCWTFSRHPEWMTLLGVGNMGVWFLDTRAVLAASDAHALGLNAYGHNPLDLLHQPHVYSYWWFALDWFGLTRADHLWLGALLGFVFLAVAFFQVRARSTGEVVWSALFLTAPPIVLGFNRGNADLFVFIILSLVVPGLLSRHRLVNWCAIAAVGFAAGLKYYPALAGLLWLAPGLDRRQRLIDLGGMTLLLILLSFDQMANAAHYVADKLLPRGFFSFGASVGAQLLAAPAWWGTATAVALGGASTLLWWRTAPRWTVPAEAKSCYLKFILGSVLLAGCYLVTINFAYRAAFAIWMAPFLWLSWSGAGWPLHYRRMARLASGLLVGFLWFDGVICLAINLSHKFSAAQISLLTDRLVLAEQPFIGLLVVALLGFLVPFTRDGIRELVHPERKTADN